MSVPYEVLEKRVCKLEEQLSSLEGVVNQLQGELSLKVDSDGVISAINISLEGIRIKGNKVHIDRETLIDGQVINSVHVYGKEVGKAVYSGIDRIQRRKSRI